MPLILLLLLSACETKPHKEQPKANGPVKGEFAFLLQYDGKLPSDVGFLTNHIVERRIANIMKEDYLRFMEGTKCERPIVVRGNFVNAIFVDCKNDSVKTRSVDIDVKSDVMWVSIYSEGLTEGFTDDGSVPLPKW